MPPLDGHRWTPQHLVEGGSAGFDELGVVEQLVDGCEFDGMPGHISGRSASHKVGCAFSVLNTVASSRTCPTVEAIFIDPRRDREYFKLTFHGEVARPPRAVDEILVRALIGLLDHGRSESQRVCTTVG